jgi:adenine phosphoribosyltransferase
VTTDADLRALIRDVPDFPRPGVLFRDITPLLRRPEAFNHVLARLSDYVQSRNPTAVVGIESRGFLFATPIASGLGLPFVPIRRPGKLPSERMSVEYTLEYGSGQMDIHKDALGGGDRVVVIDDLIATGGTAEGAVRLVEMLGAEVVGVAFLVELTALGGRRRIEGYDICALLPIE